MLIDAGRVHDGSICKAVVTWKVEMLQYVHFTRNHSLLRHIHQLCGAVMLY